MIQTLCSSTPTPLTPPMLEEDRLLWLRLFRSRRVGVSTFYRLLQEHGTAQAALEALPDLARSAGISDYSPCSADQARAEMRAGQRLGAKLVCHGDPAYPDSLTQIEDAPPLFWALGDLNLLARPCLALVGARNASSLGERMARSLAEGLATAGITVVSGLARGIDSAAHQGALKSGTVAVLGGGVDVIYPRENKRLFHDIGRQGLRLSEQPMGLQPQARHFPMRNRIISGLCRGVILVEAATRSGSLITARNALDQGREVMAVPGHPFDARAAGCNLMIRDGARLIRGVEDVFDALGPLALPLTEPRPARDWRAQARAHGPALARPDAARPAPGTGALETGATPAPTPPPAAPPRAAQGDPAANSPRDMQALQRQILARLGPSPLSEDQLIRDLDLPAQTLTAALLALELEGRIARSPGGLLARAS